MGLKKSAHRDAILRPVPSPKAVQYGSTKDLLFLPIPGRLRYRSDKSFETGIWMNCGLSFAATFLISNLYYCQPLLIQMSISFAVSYERISLIPTLIQVGYAVGMLFICPLGDLIRRRQLILFLELITTALTIGLATTRNLHLFEAISFLVGLANVSPQILVPLAADLAPPARRTFAYSIVLVGMLSGLLLARVLAGLIAQFSSWRVVYYMAVGVQCAVLILCYCIIPDTPPKNRQMTYWGILWSMAKYGVTEPVMVQIELLTVATSTAFASYWVTLTFLLGGEPFNYSTLSIGLVGLVGIGGMTIGPFAGRLMDHISPWYGIFMGTVFLAVFQAIHTAAGGFSLPALIVSCIGLDVMRQIQNVSIVACLFGIDMAATSRLNSLFVLSYYIGQLTGTSVGTKVFVDSGWRACAALGVALYAFQIAVLLLRGPHCQRTTWFGYEGGFGFLKSVPKAVDEMTTQKAEIEVA
ncbi:unnamed protein product [Cyclocybe aegerita]|uniref:Major facilitator superfamily (MFS) profile domain-containing protein n=1 Tax=Cyclocybe aegerita TaxID=1973307 RepID=A0A8S0W143_CYCAE|nr:unnamed protein product [Cyclocybe aegerita]